MTYYINVVSGLDYQSGLEPSLMKALLTQVYYPKPAATMLASKNRVDRDFVYK